MKPNYVIIAFVAIAIVGLAAFVLRVSPWAERKMSSSTPPTSMARELPSAAKSLVNDVTGRNPSEPPRTTSHILELVPMGTTLEAARQIMTEHQFVCSVDCYTNPAQMSNGAIWNTAYVKGGRRFAVTNVSRLKCESNGCAVTFWLVNSETISLSVKGQF